MKLHEYQAKELLRQYGVASPPFFIASTIDQVKEILNTQNIAEAVLKIQVHAGGRKKAGGVHIVRGREGIVEAAKKLIGMKIINTQTGARGAIAHQLMITSIAIPVHEYYLAVTIDRKKARCVVIVSKEGGIDIEDSQQILVEPIGASRSLHHFQLLRIAQFLGWAETHFEAGWRVIAACVKSFFEFDAELIEINPLIIDHGKEFLALDAKMVIDDNALFRHPKFKSLDDLSQRAPLEARAYTQGLAYVELDGDIGCMVNGAGLAMATMDLIYLYGGKPANFLDVGGGASFEKIVEGLKIVLSDERLKAILINIFGGIMDCELIAKAFCGVASERKIEIPVVVRMEGNHADKARQILTDSRLPIIAAESLDEAAQTVCQS